MSITNHIQSLINMPIMPKHLEPYLNSNKLININRVNNNLIITNHTLNIVINTQTLINNSHVNYKLITLTY